MDIVSLKAQARTETGKSANRKSRKNGRIPCVIYGGDEQVMFSTDYLSMRSLVYTPDFKLAEIDLDGKKYKSILKDIQFDPVTDEIVHADFQQLVDGKIVKVEVPVKYFGTSEGVKGGGTLVAKLRKVKIKTTAENLINEVNIDISSMLLGDSVRVKDIEVNEGVTIMNNPGIPVFSVEVPRLLKTAEEEEAEAAEAAAEAAEGAEGAEGAEAAEGAETPTS